MPPGCSTSVTFSSVALDPDGAMQFARWTSSGGLERWSDAVEAGWPLQMEVAAESFLFDGSGSRPRTISGIDPRASGTGRRSISGCFRSRGCAA